MTTAQTVAITIAEAPEAERNRAILYLVSEIAGMAEALRSRGYIDAANQVDGALEMARRIAAGEA